MAVVNGIIKDQIVMYKIRLEQFEGPLDLLLRLIEQEKLDITRVSLSLVTDQYLEYIDSAHDVSLAHMADFLTVASRLILIKSKALLPLLEFTEEEEQEIRDLEYSLAQYKKYKDAALTLGEMFLKAVGCVTRPETKIVKAVFCPPEDITVADLEASFLHVIDEIPVAEKLEEEAIREVITLEEKITHLQETLREKVQASFAELVAHATDKVEIVVSFLAMLELVKQRLIHVEQGELFSEIKLKQKNAG